MRLQRIELVVAAAAVLLAAAAAATGSRASVPGIPTIHVTYGVNCTFAMTVDGGGSVSSATAPGATLPPGSYELSVRMPNPANGYSGCEAPAFTFSGPGVTTVVEFRGEELVDERLLPALPPSSTYVAEDRNAPAQTRRVFTTAASGSSTSLLGSGSQSGSTKTFVQPELVGSAVLRYRGRLAATVGPAGKATLRLGGRAVGSLKAGVYDVRVDDAAAKAGFFLHRHGRSAIAVTSRPFVGRRTMRVALTTGRWTFFSRVGPPTAFAVVAP